MRLYMIYKRLGRSSVLVMMSASLLVLLETINLPAARSQQPSNQVLRLEAFLKQLDSSRDIVAGDQWGRDSSSYPNLVGVYRIRDRLLVLVAQDTEKQLIMEPYSGKALLLDRAHSDELVSLIKSGRQTMGVSSLQTKDGLSIREEQSPGQTWSCHSNFASYLTASNAESGSTRSFFIVVRFSLRREGVGRCTGALPPYQKINTTLDEAATVMLGLPDHTVLVFDLSHGYLLRLDGNFRQHTTLDDKIFIVDAAPIVDSFNGEPRKRYATIKRAVDKLDGKT